MLAAQGGEENNKVHGTVLEPCKVGMMMEMSGGSGDIQLKLSDLRMNLSPDVLELAMSLQSSVLEPLVQPAPDKWVISPQNSVQFLCLHSIASLDCTVFVCHSILHVLCVGAAGLWQGARASCKSGATTRRSLGQLGLSWTPVCCPLSVDSPSGAHSPPSAMPPLGTA